MSSGEKLLSKEDIEEVTGFKEFDNIEDLEILFNNFTELSSLNGFPKLRRLACIDNGIQRISHLEPVSLTLQILNLSDQDISKIENLNLPNLRELYLHRNYIRTVGSSSLSGCPRLKKLWLCQNQITTIDGLHGVPELQELWLQSNNITSLEGLACCPALQHLGLAGNNVSDFAEVRRLSALGSLNILSFQDIHFGRCPVTDEDGYKEFISCHLPRVQILDGVEISKGQVDDALTSYAKEVSMFNDMMSAIEDSHVKNLQSIAHKQQSRTSHSSILEKEMVSALGELEGFVAEGRKNISRQMKRQNEILHHNIKDLKHNIDVIYKDTKKSVDHTVANLKTEYDLTESIFLTLEKVYGAIAEVSDTLAAAKSESQPSPSGGGGYIYHPISDNTPDFQHLAAILGGVGGGFDETFAVRGIKPIGLMKLFKTYMHADELLADGGGGGTGGSRSPTKSTMKAFMQVGSSSRRAFTVCTLSQLGDIVNNNWSRLEETLVFCSSPGVATALFMSDSSSQYMFQDDYGSSTGGGKGSGSGFRGGKDDTSSMLLGEAEMTSYQAAKKLVPLVMICCDIDIVTTGIATYLQEAAASKDPQMIRLPVNASARADLLGELRCSKKVVGLQLEHGMGWVYTIPPSRRQGGRVSTSDGKKATFSNAEVISLEYICVCTDSVVEGGLKLLEQRLEVLLAPSLEGTMGHGGLQEDEEETLFDERGNIVAGKVASSSTVLKTFEANLKQQVGRYVDQVLEELTSEQADVLRDVNGKVHRKEDQLKQLKEELVQERKLQENLLRDMRVYNDQGNGSDTKGKGKPRMSKYN